MDAERKTFFFMTVEIRILASVITRVSTRFIHERFSSKNADISGLQYGVLRTLSYESFTLSELSRRFVLDPSTLVPVIDALERKGLVARGKDPHDRRRIPLSLTPEGAKLLDSLPLFHEEDLVFKILDHMGEEKSRELLQLLREVVAEMPDGNEMLDSVSSRLYSLQAGEDVTYSAGLSHTAG